GPVPDWVDDGANAFHVSRIHVPPVDRRGVLPYAAEFHRRVAGEGRRTDADRIVEREAEDGVGEAVILDETLNRMGDGGGLQSAHASNTRGTSSCSRISASARSVVAPG